MYKHLFKLMWNKRKQNFLLLSEIFVSFIVIFAVFSFFIFYYSNYRKPLGISYKDVWSVRIDQTRKPSTGDSILTDMNNVERSLRLPQIEAVSYASSNIPFSNSMWINGVKYKGKNYSNINNYVVGQSFKDVWDAKVVEGRWFNEQDAVQKNIPLLINESLRKEIFGKSPAIGNIFENEDKKYVIIGVLQDIKTRGDFYPSGNGTYTKIDTGMAANINILTVKVKPGTNAAFEARIYKMLSNNIKSANISINHVTDMRNSKNSATIIPMLIFGGIACFLLINVALGLFGVMWYNINKRRGEIGLRRAIGASGAGVSKQLVTESMILATMSIALGTFFAIQFPILNVFNVGAGIYLIAIILAILFIYLLVFLCSVYPGKQAAAIHPAVALHEE